ncbi:hypothetical protein ACT29H_16725 [Thermophagus sp. OGC60D27]|uniref:hypothetical protein n=1 Tax=Thermophagus sp. OGC60D27 TaxID=3458415 RepID=UPI0040384450
MQRANEVSLSGYSNPSPHPSNSLKGEKNPTRITYHSAKFKYYYFPNIARKNSPFRGLGGARRELSL